MNADSKPEESKPTEPSAADAERERPDDSPAKNDPEPETAKPKRRRRRFARRSLITVTVLVALYALFGFVGVPLLIKTVGLSRLTAQLHGSAALEKASFNPFTFALTLQGFELADEAGARVAAFERFEGNFQCWATIFRPGYRFLRAELTKPILRAELAEDGTFNIAALFKPAPEPVEAREPLKRIPHVVVRHMGVEEADLSFRDFTTPEPFEFAIDHLTFRLDGLDTYTDTANPLRLVATTPSGERLTWEGSFNVDPLSSRGSLTLEQLELPRFMPYALAMTEARLVEGRLSLDLRYDFAPLALPRLATVELPRLSLADLKVRHSERDLVALSNLDVLDINVDADARTLLVDRLTITEPSAYVRRDADGDLELLSLLDLPHATRPAERRPALEEQAKHERIDPRDVDYPIEQIILGIAHLLEDALGDWDLSLGAVALERGTFHWTDASVRRLVEVSLTNLELSAGPIRSRDGFEAPFELRASIAEQGRLHCAGQAGLLSQRYAARVDLESLPVGPIAPYLPRNLGADLPAAELRKATLELNGDAQANLSPQGDLAAGWDGRIALRTIEIAEADSDELLLSLSELELTGIAEASHSAQGAIALNWEGSTRLAELKGSAAVAGPVDLSLGDLNVTGRLKLALSPDAQPQLAFVGDLRTHDADVSLPEIASAVASYAGVTLTGINLDAETERLHIAQAQIDRPTFTGLASVMPTEPIELEEEVTDRVAAAPASPTRAEKTESERFIELPIPLTIAIDKASITGASVELRDENEDPPIVVAAHDINIEAESITTDGSSVARLELSSTLQRTGRVRLSGEVNPFTTDLFADVKLDVTTLPLKPYDPFAAHYIGHLIDRGRLTLSLPVTVEAGQVRGSLSANLDTFYLGKKVDSPTAPNVPIKLGLDLLRDRREQINVNVGIRGDMNDPKFSFANIIMQAILNTVARAALAPFDLLASLFAGDRDVGDLSLVVFEPGSADLTSDTITKLDVLAAALTDRPALHLDIVGMFNAEQDAPVLRAAMLGEQLLNRAREKDASIRTLSDADRRRLVAKLFEERFPERVIQPVPIPPGRLDQPTVSLEAMEQALLEAIVVPEERLLELASRRAAAVYEILSIEHAIAEDRLTLRKPISVEEAEAEEPIVRFDLQ